MKIGECALESVKRPGVERNTAPPVSKQSYQLPYCLVLFVICPVRFTNLPAFNWPFLPVEMGDTLQKAPLENLQK